MKSPLTGLKLESQFENKRPIAVMVDGSFKALPNAGLQEASIVFSACVEGTIVRYMAIFLDKAPERVGPIRSVRPYFIDWATTYQSFLIHCGGSPQALERLTCEKKVIDINYSYIFNESGKQVPVTLLDWFKLHQERKPPFNLYINIEYFRKNINLKKIKSLRWDLPFKLNSELMNFTAYESIKHGEQLRSYAKCVKSITIKRDSYNKIHYFYDEKDKKYRRFIKNKVHSEEKQIHVDENTNQPIKIDNLAVIWVKSKPLAGDLAGRLELKTFDKGKAMFFVNGRAFQGSWVKLNLNMAIRFFDKENREILFNNGNIWIEVVSKSTKLNIS